LLILIPPTAPHSSSSIIQRRYNWTIRARCTKYIQFLPTPSNKRIIALSSISNFLLHSIPAVLEVPWSPLLQMLLTVSSCSDSRDDSCPQSQTPRTSQAISWQRSVQHGRSDQALLSPVYNRHATSSSD
jgi:hypothetical protein